MAYRSSPSGTTAASVGPSPGASPTLPTSSPILGQVKVPQGALAIDDLLKRERVWWSEHTLLEVQKMEVTVKEELAKATAALRDHFCTQIENERNDNIQRVASLERSVGRLREEVDAVRAQQRQPAPTISSSSLEAAVRRVSAELEQSEVGLRLELQALEAKVEDYHRAHTEDLSVALAASQTTVEEMTALRGRTTAAERSCEVMMTSIQRFEKVRNMSPELDLARVREEARQIVSQELADECTRKQALMTQSTEPDLEATRKVDEDVMRLSIELEAERAARAEALEAESTARRTEVDGLRSDLARERSAHSRELEDARTAWLNEATSLREELSNEHLERAHELASIRIATEAAASTARISVPGSNSVGNHIKELADGLFAERTQRKEEVQKLQAYVEKALDEHLSKSVTKEDTVRELAGFLEAECRARKADVEELRVSLAEATGLEALTNALAGLRTALEEEAEQSSLMRDKLAESGKSGGAGAGLVRELAYSGSGERRHAEAEARKSDISAALGKEATELVGRIRGLGGELRAELSTRLEIESTELRAEFGTRLELAAAKLRAELEASKAELRRDIAAMCTDVHNATINELRGAEAKGQSFNTAGLQTSAAAVGQLNEVLRLMELMEALTEKICGETAERKRAEAHFEQRLAKVEQVAPRPPVPAEVPQQLQPAPQMQNMPVATASSTTSGGAPDPQKAQERQLKDLQAQSMISRDLKNSLEKLVDRVQYMLKPDDGGMFSFSLPASRSSSQAPVVERQRSVPRRDDGQVVTPSPVHSRAGGCGSSAAVLAPSAAAAASKDEGILPASPQTQSHASRRSTDAPPGTPGTNAGAFAGNTLSTNKVGQISGNPSPVITASSSHQNSVGGALPGPLAAAAAASAVPQPQQMQQPQIQPQPQLATQQAQAPQLGVAHAVMRMPYGTVAPNAAQPAASAGVFRAVGAPQGVPQGIWQTRVNIQARPEAAPRPWG